MPQTWFDELGAGHGAAWSFGQRCEHAELEGRELNPLLSEIDGAVSGVEEPAVGDSELGGGEAGQPAVDGLGPEVERGGVVGVIAERDGFRKGWNPSTASTSANGVGSAIAI